MRNMHPSDKFLLVRKHVFSTLRKYGLKAALNIADKYHNTGEIDSNHYKGIRAELGFFNNHQKKLSLYESLDSGNHADFIGNIKGEIYGIDVTTNIETKDLKTYSKDQDDGYKYLIALVNPETLKLEDVFNINFPKCPDCGGHLIDILFLEPSGTDNEGFINYSYTQKVISVCSENPLEHSIKKKECEFMTSDIPTYINDYIGAHDYMDDLENPLNINGEIEKYAISNMKFFRKELKSNIMACGSPDYIITDPRDGDGYYGTKMYFKRPFLKDEIWDIYDMDFRELY